MVSRKLARQSVVAAALGLALGIQPVAAQDRHGPDRHVENHWHGNDIHRFHDRDEAIWRGGRWFHGAHSGRAGWWWIVGGDWYFYPAPVYPYPNPLVPPLAVAPPPAPVPNAAYWYYCPNPAGYYPYVPACPTPWQPVQAN
ncbi:MAG TPA: hypothetical protein VGL83_03705 [Stellaceae bacterium]|jgi:hypothetical protein